MIVLPPTSAVKGALLLRMGAGDKLSLHEQAQLRMPGDQLAVLESGPVMALETATAATLLPCRSVVQGLLFTNAGDFMVNQLLAGDYRLLAMDGVPAEFFGASAAMNFATPPLSHVLEPASTFEVSARNETHEVRSFKLELWGTWLGPAPGARVTKPN